MPDPAGHLSGRCVLLTRPHAESAALRTCIGQAGGTALIFPTLEIEPVTLSSASEAALVALPEQQLAVFVSTNAVRHGLSLIRARGGWPPSLAAAAVEHPQAGAVAVDVDTDRHAPGAALRKFRPMLNDAIRIRCAVGIVGLDLRR